MPQNLTSAPLEPQKLNHNFRCANNSEVKALFQCINTRFFETFVESGAYTAKTAAALRWAHPSPPIRM